MRNKASERLSGVYALNALDDSERQAFEACLQKSETLRAEVTELQDTAVLLGQAVEPVEPPAHLRTRILAQIENSPQLAPEAGTERAGESLRTRLASLRGRLSGRLVAVPLVAVAALALVIAVPLTTRTGQQPTAPQATGVSAITTAADHQSVQLQAGMGNLATVIWSPTLQRAAVKVQQNNLPPGRAYELWVVDADGTAQPAGLIAADSARWTELTAPISKGASVRMTVEPKWGSKQPTSPTLFELSV